MRSSDSSDQSAEDHVNRGGEECGGDEDRDSLRDKTADRELVKVTPYSTAVADSFDLEEEMLAKVRLR
jgi:hypothetical protein